MSDNIERRTEAADLREMEQVRKRLNELKSLDLKTGTVSLWIVHRKLVKTKAQYSAFKVETGDELRPKLAGAVDRHVQKSNQVRPYEYITEDQDDCLLEQPTGTTDFDEIIALVSRNGEEFKVEQQQQLMNAWGYVVKLQIDETFVYGFRKIGRGWSTNNTGATWVFRNRVLYDLDDEPVFRADNKIDFIAFEGSVFILDKSSFETAVNFREGMQRHRDEILDEFQDIDLVSDVEVIRKSVGDNLHKLRKLASVRNNGYYRLPWYMERLKEVNDQEGWGLPINEKGTIEICEENVDLALTLLNNDRLKSPITDEMFDVPIKRSVTEPA